MPARQLKIMRKNEDTEVKPSKSQKFAKVPGHLADTLIGKL
jgi:hypothetical protein